MEVYLDNSATTKCYDAVKDIVATTMCEDYGNPSSMHKKGMEAENYIKQAKDIFAHTLKVQPKEIFFTSGGTESNNLAVIGYVKANKRAGKHLITSSIEHPAILNTMQYLEAEKGYKVTYLEVDHDGRISLEQLKKSLTAETILVSIMHVNNEIGSVQPIEEIASIIKKYNKNIAFHVDGVQGFGKYKIHPSRMGVDLYSISGHKIHGPKGVGVLYINSKLKMRPIIYGGAQQNNIRSGTENVPGIAGIAVATKEIYENREQNNQRMMELKRFFKEKLKELDEVTIHGGRGEHVAPHIVSVGFAGIKSEVLLHTLEEYGIYVSSGSACASNHPAISGVLKGIGTKKKYLDSTIRFSFSEFTTKEEIDYTIETLYNCVPMLRRYTRR